LLEENVIRQCTFPHCLPNGAPLEACYGVAPFYIGFCWTASEHVEETMNKWRHAVVLAHPNSSRSASDILGPTVPQVAKRQSRSRLVVYVAFGVRGPAQPNSDSLERFGRSGVTHLPAEGQIDSTGRKAALASMNGVPCVAMSHKSPERKWTRHRTHTGCFFTAPLTASLLVPPDLHGRNKQDEAIHEKPSPLVVHSH
jgi:hypothetical protein